MKRETVTGSKADNLCVPMTKNAKTRKKRRGACVMQGQGEEKIKRRKGGRRERKEGEEDHARTWGKNRQRDCANKNTEEGKMQEGEETGRRKDRRKSWNTEHGIRKYRNTRTQEYGITKSMRGRKTLEAMT